MQLAIFAVMLWGMHQKHFIYEAQTLHTWGPSRAEMSQEKGKEGTLNVVLTFPQKERISTCPGEGLGKVHHDSKAQAVGDMTIMPKRIRTLVACSTREVLMTVKQSTTQKTHAERRWLRGKRGPPRFWKLRLPFSNYFMIILLPRKTTWTCGNKIFSFGFCGSSFSIFSIIGPRSGGLGARFQGRHWTQAQIWDLYLLSGQDST